MQSIVQTFFVLAAMSIPGGQIAKGSDKNFRYNHFTGECRNERGELGQNPMFLGVCGDYRDSSLTTANLMGGLLMGFDLSRTSGDAIQDRIDMTAADARGANFSGGLFYEITFKAANLEGAKFNNTIFLARGSRPGSDFTGANLRKADFRHAKFVKATFDSADLRGADFRFVTIDPAGTVTWAGAEYDKNTKLPFPEAVAEAEGMYKSTEPPDDHIPDVFEPEFLSSENVPFSTMCQNKDDCKSKYGTAATRGSLSLRKINLWQLTFVGAGERTEWWNSDVEQYWIDTGKLGEFIWSDARRWCANEAANLPSRQEIQDAVSVGLHKGLPSLGALSSSIWSEESYNNVLRYVYFPSDGLTYVDHIDNANRFVCLRGK